MKQILRIIESKSIMISIRSQHFKNIFSRKKTLELRTWLPKDIDKIIQETSGIWVYVYIPVGVNKVKTLWNGKVVARFWFDEYDKLEWDENLEISSTSLTHNQLLEQSCVDYYYLNNNFSDEDANIWGYAWYIKQLEIFDEPKELNEFYKTTTWLSKEKIVSLIKNNDFRLPVSRIKKAPQKYVWVYVEDKELEK